jgi:hypothetical protein
MALMGTTHPRANRTGPSVLRPRVDGTGDVLSYTLHYHHPPLSAFGIDVLDLECHAGQCRVGQFHSGLRPDDDCAAVEGIVDGKDLRLAVPHNGQPTEILTAQEGEAVLLGDRLELALLI